MAGWRDEKVGWGVAGWRDEKVGWGGCELMLNILCVQGMSGEWSGRVLPVVWTLSETCLHHRVPCHGD